MSVREILERVARGELGVEEAEKRLRLFSLEVVEGLATLDTGREERRGVPEVILAEGKDEELLVRLAGRMLASEGRAILSRIGEGEAKRVVEAVGPERYRYERRARILVLYGAGHRVERTGGRVAVVSGGAADTPVAEEARVMAEEMGCEVKTFYDVGVAALHRALGAVREVLEWGADAVVVAAGREAALASLVSSLVDVPVVGLPTSVGYGFAGKGVSALSSMLQSCPLGMAVVNIDAGVAAGVFAALIANRVAAARRGRGP